MRKALEEGAATTCSHARQQEGCRLWAAQKNYLREKLMTAPVLALKKKRLAAVRVPRRGKTRRKRLVSFRKLAFSRREEKKEKKKGPLLAARGGKRSRTFSRKEKEVASGRSFEGADLQREKKGREGWRLRNVTSGTHGEPRVALAGAWKKEHPRSTMGARLREKK